MRFAFQRLRLFDGGLDIPRPILRVRVKGPRRSALADVLVDSGASDMMFPRTFLEGLGVLFSGEKCEASSFCGERHEADVGTVGLQFGGGYFELTTRVLAFHGKCIPVLGLRDFFNRYLVAFDAGALSLFISEPRRPPLH